MTDTARSLYANQAIALCRDLVASPSVSGDEGAAAQVLAAAMRRLDFADVGADKYGNVLGVIHGDRPGPCVLLDGHLDTVPVPMSMPDAAAWHHPPFAGEIVEGKLFGRGASDMKGALACMTVAASLFAATRERRFAGSLCVAGSVHEECFEGVACRAISDAVKPDCVIIGEASGLNLHVGQRGRAEITLETCGKSAHAAHPEAGANAVTMMVRLLEKVEAFIPPEHPVLGKGITVVTDILSSPYPGASVVPAACRATCDRRLLLGESREDVLRPFQEAIAELGVRQADFRAEVSFAQGRAACYTGAIIEAERFYPAWLFGEDEPFVRKALAGLRREGFSPAVSHYAFCTNGSHYAGEAGIPTVGFGPSLERLAHIADEYIELDQIHRAVAGYAAILDGLFEAD